MPVSGTDSGSSRPSPAPPAQRSAVEDGKRRTPRDPVGAPPSRGRQGSRPPRRRLQGFGQRVFVAVGDDGRPGGHTRKGSFCFRPAPAFTEFSSARLRSTPRDSGASPPPSCALRPASTGPSTRPGRNHRRGGAPGLRLRSPPEPRGRAGPPPWPRRLAPEPRSRPARVRPPRRAPRPGDAPTGPRVSQSRRVPARRGRSGAPPAPAPPGSTPLRPDLPGPPAAGGPSAAEPSPPRPGRKAD